MIVGIQVVCFDLLWILYHLSAIPANTCQSTIDYGLNYCFKVFFEFYTWQFSFPPPLQKQCNFTPESFFLPEIF